MMLLCTILFPILSGIGIFSLKLERQLRCRYYIAALLLTDCLGLLALALGKPIRLFPLTENFYLYFSLDQIGSFFLIIILSLYTAIYFYAFMYLEEMEEEDKLFFVFYFLSFGALIAACMAGNLVTLYLCFESATLMSMPLVLYDRTKEAVFAGLKYLFYSIGGALLGLIAILFLCIYGADANAFILGGFLDIGKIAEHETILQWAIFLGIVGFGAKAGLFPLHNWLPTAHPAAPAPASALLSGIVAKTGLLAIIRLVYFSAGADFLRGTWVQTAWTSLALMTVFMGSMMAFREKVMKKRLAYSTISQLSYVMLGLSLLDPSGLFGALLHVAAHAFSKSVLFLCAGVFICKLGKRNVKELRGIGKQMPITIWCFFFASLSLVGIPPMGGFTSKWAIACAALSNGVGVFSVLIPIVLLISALLTAGYLLPVVMDAFFIEGEKEKKEPSIWMLAPMIVLCVAALVVGLFGNILVAKFI